MTVRLQRLRLQMMASQTAALVGERLREARQEKGWTRRQLVKEMDGVATENDVYRWETGKHRPRDDALAAAARALGKPLPYFLSPERGPTPDLLAHNGERPGEADRLAALERAVTENTERLADISGQLDQLLSRLPGKDEQTRAIHEAFEEYARRLGEQIGKRPPRSRRATDRPPEAPPAAA